jgi:glycosyltransferase involved in cell wall biosynthesis
VRIAWDVSPLALAPTGIGRYVGESLRAAVGLAADDDIRVVAVSGLRGRRQLRRYADSLPARVEQRLWTLPLARVPRAVANRLPAPTLELFAGRVDAFVASDWLHPRTRALSVAVCHDLVALRLPQTTIRGTQRGLAPRLASLRRADVVVVNSAYTGREVAGVLGVAAERIVVARPGVDAAFRDATPAPPGGVDDRPYLLCVATSEPRKNLAVLIDAFALVRDAQPDMMLVLVGGSGWGEDGVAERIQAGSLERSVLRTGYLPDAALPGVFAAARVFCLPSLFEGFGMPVAEALAAGVPSVVSRHPSLDEACGDAAWRVASRDPQAMAAAILTAVSDSDARRRAIARGRAHASTLTWQRCAGAILHAIRRRLA